MSTVAAGCFFPLYLITGGLCIVWRYRYLVQLREVSWIFSPLWCVLPLLVPCPSSLAVVPFYTVDFFFDLVWVLDVVCHCLSFTVFSTCVCKSRSWRNAALYSTLCIPVVLIVSPVDHCMDQHVQKLQRPKDTSACHLLIALRGKCKGLRDVRMPLHATDCVPTVWNMQRAKETSACGFAVTWREADLPYKLQREWSRCA